MRPENSAYPLQSAAGIQDIRTAGAFRRGRNHMNSLAAGEKWFRFRGRQSTLDGGRHVGPIALAKSDAFCSGSRFQWGGRPVFQFLKSSLNTMSTAQAPVSPQLPEDIADLPEKAVHLAAEILNQSRARETGFERTNSARMARMMDDLPGKKFTIAMADQVLRMQKPTRSASRLNSLLSEYGLPRYFGWLDRVLLWSGARLARFLPGFVMPFVKRRVRSDSAHVIISAEPDQFPKYIRQRTDAGIRINFNQLGEAVLGDREADRRLSIYLQRFQEPGIQYASVKLSSIVSQISLIGYEQTLEEVKERLRQVYRAAQQGGGCGWPQVCQPGYGRVSRSLSDG